MPLLADYEDESRYSAPDEGTEDEDATPYEQGYADCQRGLPRKFPNYYHSAAKKQWLEGWDDANQEEL